MKVKQEFIESIEKAKKGKFKKVDSISGLFR